LQERLQEALREVSEAPAPLEEVAHGQEEEDGLAGQAEEQDLQERVSQEECEVPEAPAWQAQPRRKDSPSRTRDVEEPLKLN
jgi:hypothetical protein